MKCSFCSEEAHYKDKIFGPSLFRCCSNESCMDECAQGCFNAMMEGV